MNIDNQLASGDKNSKKLERSRKISSFLKKFIALAIFVTFIDFSNAQFYNYYIYDIQDEIGDYKITTAEDKESFLNSSESGFVEQSYTQTEIGDRLNQNQVIEHKVIAGDTLMGLSKIYGVKRDTIINVNNFGENINNLILKPGQIIKIPPVDGLVFRLDKNYKISELSKKYNVKEEDIIRQNKFSTNLVSIEKGKIIIIPGAKPIKEKIEPIQVKQNKSGNKAVSDSIIKTIKKKNYQAPKSNGKLTRPSGGAITQYYHTGHFAIDIANRSGGPIFAADGGKVIKAKGSGWNGGYGNVIVIDHGNGMKTLYGHNKEIYVKEGDTVKRGQVISWMGNTGRVYGATGIHLHFEVIVGGTKLNPLDYIN